MKNHVTLGEYIIDNQMDFQYSSGELSSLLSSIKLASKVVNHEVNKAGLVDILGNAGETNIQGEDQQKLDVYANEVFMRTLVNRQIFDLHKCKGQSAQEGSSCVLQTNLPTTFTFGLTPVVLYTY